MKRRTVRAVATGAVAALALGLVALLRPIGRLPAFGEVRAAYARSDATLLDRHGEVLHRLRVDRSARRLEWIPLDAVSPALRAAIVAAEDRRFYEHRGFDLGSIAGAALDSLRMSRLRGASTITMQVASKLVERAGHRGRRTPIEKWNQIRAARELERSWTKLEILEAYLNLVPFRGELEGVASASAGLFGKKPHGLDEVESVVLAALVRAPNATVEATVRRARALAEAMHLRVDASELEARTEGALARPALVQADAAVALHVALRLLEPAAGETRAGLRERVSTLDGSLQRFAAEALGHHLAALRAQNVRDGAVLVVDNATGEVLAYVGNAGEQGSARYVDGIQAYRQAGSTLKPFVYGLALERRYLTAASLIDDSPLDVPVFGGVYRPKNYDRQFHGPVTARTALASSLNVPAVKTLGLVGVEATLDLLGRLGFRNLRAPDFYGPSLALGSVDCTLW
ncbi:MAG: penicillin-binding protein 1C, partial [Acidobacteria bacterium]